MMIGDINLCQNSGFLRVFLILKVVFRAVTIIVPFLFMFKCVKEIYPRVISGESLSANIAPIFKSLLASFVVFMAPTLLNAIFTMLTDSYSEASYSACMINSTIEKINYFHQLEIEAEKNKVDSQAVDREVRDEIVMVKGVFAGNNTSGSGNPEASSGGTGIWAQSQFPLPSGATSCRSSIFGPRVNPVNGQQENHSGDDYGASCGTSVYAAMGGTVIDTANDGGYHGGRGNYVTIQHSDGTSAVYMHSSNVLVKPGQVVNTGQEIMKVGTTGMSTGCHLHITIKDPSGNNVAPMNYIPTLKSCY